MNVLLSVYILCRDRPAYAHECLSSVLKSITPDTSVIISDNSIGDAVGKMAHDFFPNLEYKRRTPVLSAEEHINLIIAECSTEYIVLFHDDDKLLSGYVEMMLGTLMARPDCSAVACSARIIDQRGSPTDSFLYRSNKSQTVIRDYNSLLYPYLTILYGCGAPPFPSYLYRTSKLKHSEFSCRDGGKHADLTMLIKLLQTGPLIWLNETLVEYRVHHTSDSAHESIPDRLSLIRYLKKYKMVDSFKDVNPYRFFFWSRWAVERKILLRVFMRNAVWRERIVFKFIILYFFRLLIVQPILACKIIIKYSNRMIKI